MLAAVSTIVHDAKTAVGSFLGMVLARLPNDAAVLTAFEACVVAVGLWAAVGSAWAWLARTLRPALVMEVTRRTESWGALTVISGALTGIAFTVVTTAQVPAIDGRKVILVLTNTMVLLWVVLLNEWSRNKILGWWLSFQTGHY